MSDFSQKRWNELVQFKIQKQKDQMSITAEYQKALNDEDGLIENSRLTVKNLNAAIATAKQPGYFKYHSDFDRVKKIESRNELKAYNQRIAQIQKEIDHATAEMAEMERRRRSALESGKLPAVGSLSAWFAQYGGKPRQVPTGGVTQFLPSAKVYGGTKHHPAFKSLASGMKRGRCVK
eukprot:g4615.t1